MLETSVAKPKENIELNIDKFHKTGKYDDTTKAQPVTAKFTGHSFKEQVYLKRKALKNSDTNFRIVTLTPPTGVIKSHSKLSSGRIL